MITKNTVWSRQGYYYCKYTKEKYTYCGHWSIQLNGVILKNQKGNYIKITSGEKFWLTHVKE